MQKIGGSATLNGVIMINSSAFKIAHATRNKDGTISVNNFRKLTAAMKWFQFNIERATRKIPVIRELAKILFMYIIIIYSLISGIFKTITDFKGWNFKRIFSFIFLAAFIYAIAFMNDYYSLAALAASVFIFNKQLSILLKYHGAEHKSINTYENSGAIEDVTVDYACTFSKIHLRCGTNIIILLIPLILLYSVFAEQFIINLNGGDYLDFILCILILGISIELFRLFQKPLMRWALKPGLWAQKYITTKEPDERQLEVAICALKAVVTD
ncbi:MAG: DUF1385 domain-containing protein [Bacillota bacterium]|nr:DUF1385 domain-containing protein [Bacillota bacterium]